MFEITETSFGPYRKYRVYNEQVKSGFSVVPELGANLLELEFSGQSVLDGHATPDLLRQGDWGKSALLFPFPNRLADGKYSWRGADYQFELNEKVNNHAIHGFVQFLPFEPGNRVLEEKRAEFNCSLKYSGENAAYPFPFTLSLKYEITSRNEFNFSAVVRNDHSHSIPVGLGWHPYFVLDGAVDTWGIDIPNGNLVEVDARMLPTGKKSSFPKTESGLLNGVTYDSCLEVDSQYTLYRVALFNEQERLQIVASQKLFPFFQIFTPPQRKSVALEPMTCNINAFNNGQGLVTLEPGKNWMTSFRVEYHRTSKTQ